METEPWSEELSWMIHRLIRVPSVPKVANVNNAQGVRTGGCGDGEAFPRSRFELVRRGHRRSTQRGGVLSIVPVRAIAGPELAVGGVERRGADRTQLPR